MAPLLGALKKSLRRSTKQSSRNNTETKSNKSSSSDADAGSNGTAPTSGSITPPSISCQSDLALNLQIPRDDNDGPYVASRPPLPNSGSSNGSSTPTNTTRYSLYGMSGSASPSGSVQGKYAPRITNIEDRTWVHQKILAIRGEVGEPNKLVDGVVIVYHANNQMPPTEWPVCASSFKALVSLTPGPNKLRFEYIGPRQSNSNSNSSLMSINYVPTMNSPPLQLAILVAKDSPRTFDSVPSRAEREGNGIETAIRKFRMAAYLWQAFTGEQMARHAKDEKARLPPRKDGGSSLVRRSFRFEEEWIQGTSNGRDRDNGIMRSEARVHVIEMDKTVSEMQDLQLGLQTEAVSGRSALYDLALDAVNDYFKPRRGQKHYVAALVLDAHWDPQSQMVRGHAAAGDAHGDTHLAIFGSHCLWAYPTCLEEVDPCFTDCNPTDTKFVANPSNEAGSSWEVCNVGVGAHLQQVGRMFGLPQRPFGVMGRDYMRLHRSFVSREAFCTRTKEKGGPVNSAREECGWHPLDYLHLRAHPCFQTIIDNQPPEPGVTAWPTGSDAVMVSASSGLSHMEIYADGEGECCGYVVFDPDTRRTTLNERDIRRRLPADKRLGTIRLVVRSLGGGSFETDDFKRLASKESSLKVDGRILWRSSRVGGGQLSSSSTISNIADSSEASEVVFRTTTQQSAGKDSNNNKVVLRRLVVYHGDYLNGVEFVYDDDSRQLFGNRGGKPGGDYFELDTFRGEQVVGFRLRSSDSIEALSILTSQGRMSPWFGGAASIGSCNTISLVPPQGYLVCGVSGTCGPWVESFSVIYSR